MTGTAYAASAEIAAFKGPFDGFPRRTTSRCSRSSTCTASTPTTSRRPTARTTCETPPRTPGTRPWTPARKHGYPQRPDHGPGADRHDRLHDGLRYDRHRAGHRPGQVQAAGRRRHAQAGQQDRSRWPWRRLGYSAEDIKAICDHIDEHETIEGAAKLNADHLPIFDCAFKPKNGKRSSTIWPI